MRNYCQKITSELLICQWLRLAPCRRIRITGIFLLLTFQVCARSNGQAISLQLKDATIERVFLEIRKQTSYDFLYRDELVKNLPKVTIEVRNATIVEVLEICFKNTPVTFSVDGNTIIIKEKKDSEEHSQKYHIGAKPIDVKGRVVNESGEPVSGVTVSIKGSPISTSTNAHGEFSLSSVEQDATLIFTHVSMETFELKVSGKKEILVTLKAKVNVLGGVEIVSTGFQDLPKERATGSFVHIDNETLNQQTGTNILQRLNGVSSGVLFNIGKSGTNSSPARKTNISIRGVSTIEGPTDPLIVLDNFIYDGDLNNINPNDIESVTILKDGAATSIYGAQGGNGVIILTTKKGKFNQRLKVGFNYNVILDEKKDLYSLPQISVRDYIDVEQFLFNNGFFNDVINYGVVPLALTPAVEVFFNRSLGLISASDSANLIEQLKQWDTRKDYDKYFNKKNVIQQYSINLSGGAEKIAWTVSGAYDKTESYDNMENRRINVRFNNSIKPIKHLRLNLGVYYTNNRLSGSPFPQIGSVLIQGRHVPYLKFSENGLPLPVATTYRKSYLDTLGRGSLLDWNLYPLEDYKHYSNTTDRNDITANLGLNYRLLKGLDVDISYQYQRQQASTENIANVHSYQARDLINTFAQLTRDGVTGEVVSVSHNNLPVGDILTSSSQLVQSQNFRGQANYNNTWGDHSVFAIAGFQVRETVTDLGASSTYYGYSSDPIKYGQVDFKNPYPTVFGYEQNIPGPPVFNGVQTYRFVSYYSNISYSYKDRYTFSISGRRDGSNLFGAETNDKWKPLWSTGISWELSREKFYKFDAVPYVKVRATLGYSGNVDLRKTPYPIAHYSIADPNTGYPIATVGLLNDPSLRWEQTSQLNFGIDFSTRKQRISGSVEYYYKKSNNLYGTAPSDYTGGGANTRTKNVADMMGRGVDVLLKSLNLTGTIKWNTTFLFNYNMNKVTAYYSESSQRISSLISTIAGNGVIPIVGKPVYALAAYRWGGLNSEGAPQGYLDGQLSTDYIAIFNESTIKAATSDNIRYVGPASPTIFGNLINEITWKGISLSFNISYSMGYYFRKPTISYSNLFNTGIGHPDFEKRWKKPGDELLTNVPAMVYTSDPDFYNRGQLYYFSEINVLKADNIRLQYINLMYNLSNNFLRMPIERLQLYFNAANLGILWRANKEGIDPDYPNDFAPTKTYTIGLRANF